MTKPKIKVAFIGAGYMTAEHLKAFADHSDVIIAGIYSRTIEKAIKLSLDYPGMMVYNSIEELHEKTKADIVVVSVPELSIYEVAMKCLDYTWMCLFEKPLGLDMKDSEAIYAFAKKKSAKAYVAFNRRQYSSTRTVLEDLDQSNNRRIIHILDQEDILVQRKKGVSEQLLQNWMYANSIHIIDYLTFFGRGKITGVENIVDFNYSDPSYVLAHISYDSGDIGIYEGIWNAPAPWMISVTTSSKRWEMRPVETASFQEYGSRQLNLTEKHPWDIQFKPGLRRQADEAVKAVKGLPHTLAGLDESMLTMQLISSIYGTK